MKCAFHPEIDAVGVCSNCGRAICEECKMMLGSKIYCPGCGEEVFAAGKRRSGLLTAGGVLSIVGGAFTVLAGLAFAGSVPFLTAMASGISGANAGLGFFVGAGIWALALGGVAIAGGIYALKRKKWGLSLAGAISAFFTSFIFGLLAIIFIAIRKEEFASIQEGGEK